MVLTKDEPLDGLPEAKGIIGDGEASNLGHPGSPPLLQTMASKVIEAQYPHHLQYHPIQIAWMDLDFLDEVEASRRNTYENKPPHL